MLPLAVVREGAPPALNAGAVLGFAYVTVVATAVAFVAWFALPASSVGSHRRPGRTPEPGHRRAARHRHRQRDPHSAADMRTDPCPARDRARATHRRHGRRLHPVPGNRSRLPSRHICQPNQLPRPTRNQLRHTTGLLTEPNAHLAPPAPAAERHGQPDARGAGRGCSGQRIGLECSSTSTEPEIPVVTQIPDHRQCRRPALPHLRPDLRSVRQTENASRIPKLPHKPAEDLHDEEPPGHPLEASAELRGTHGISLILQPHVA